MLSIYTNAPSLPYTVTVPSGNDWLSVKPVSGTAPASVVVSVNPAGLAPNTYQASITVNVPNANPANQLVPVTLKVSAATSPKLQVDSGALTFAFAQGAQARTERRTISNVGGGSLTFQTSAVTAAGGNWLKVSPASGTATIVNPASLVINADPTGLAPGTYTGAVSVSSAGSSENRDLPVTLTVSAVAQSILLSQTGLSFTAVVQGGTVPSQNFGILNTGAGMMDWSVSASTLSGGNNWLSVTPQSGTTDAASLNVPLVDVLVDPSGLEPGEYYGQVSVKVSSADNTPQIVSVVLTVLPPGSDPGPLIRPTGLIFTAVSGAAAPTAQAVQVSNLAGTAKTFTSGRLTTDGANWFTIQPGTGTVTPNDPVSIQVQASGTGLTPGIRRGVLTLLFGDGSVRTVNILFVLAATAPAQQTASSVHGGLREGDSACAPTKLLPVISSLGSDFTVPAAWPNLLEARIVDDCGSPMIKGSVVASFSNGDPPLPFISLKNGVWSSTWQARNTDVSQVIVSVTAEIPEQKLQGTAQVRGGLRSNVEPPVLGAGGIVNAASYAADAPLSPGSMVSIFGANLSQGESESENLPLSTKLAGTLVMIGGRQLPLRFVSEKQINAMIPYGVPVNTQHQLVVQRGNAYTLPATITLAAAQPACFTKDLSGKGQGIVVGPSGKLAEPGSPVEAGDVVTLYCAGLGEVDPGLDAGAAAPASPLAWTAHPVTLTIGGIAATIQFSGLAPGFTGLYQINATVPHDVSAGDAVPVVLTVEGLSSPAVTMAVR